MAGRLLFGGSFDPLHHGHLIVARSVAERLQVDRIVLIPAGQPPHKLGRVCASAVDRLAMCRLAVEHDSLFEVWDWEIQQPGPSYTIQTVEHFRTAKPSVAPLYWLIGMDSFRELGSWRRVSELCELCTLVTAARPGFEPDVSGLSPPLSSAQVQRLLDHVVDTPRIEIESTDIRARCARGLATRYLVPPAVDEYMLQRGLYRAS